MPTIQIELTQEEATRLSQAWVELYEIQPTIAIIRRHLVNELRAIVSHGENIKADRETPPPIPFTLE